MARLGLLGLLGVAALGGGCAKYPAGSGGQTAKLVTFTVSVAGTLNPDYVYIVALNPSTDLNPTEQGPIPVVAPPWGNGFVAGSCGYFVEWNPNQTPAYTLYQFTDSTLNNYVQIGVPISYIDVPSGGGHQLTFTLDLSQIAPSVDVANAYQSIQVNFLTMDKVPRGSAGGSKNWDALGDGRSAASINDYVTLPLRTNGNYTNAYFNQLEPTGDVVSDGDPDLDISDFGILVQGT